MKAAFFLFLWVQPVLAFLFLAESACAAQWALVEAETCAVQGAVRNAARVLVRVLVRVLALAEWVWVRDVVRGGAPVWAEV